MDKTAKNNQNTPEYLKRKESSGNINLIPDLTKREKTKIESKETVNFSSAIFIFLVMLFTVGVLGTNFYLRLQKDNYKRSISAEGIKIAALKGTELKLKNINNRYNAIHELKKDDLQYFFLTEEANNFPPEIYLRDLALTEENDFTLSGLALAPADFDEFVALLEANEYFSEVNIVNMSNLSADQKALARQYNESQYSVVWEVNGKFFKDISRGEVIDKLGEL